MDHGMFVEIIKDGLKRGHGARCMAFTSDPHTLTGMMDYCGKIWVFPIKVKK